MGRLYRSLHSLKFCAAFGVMCTFIRRDNRFLSDSQCSVTLQKKKKKLANKQLLANFSEAVGYLLSEPIWGMSGSVPTSEITPDSLH